MKRVGHKSDNMQRIFIAKREAPAYIANDGKQTPMRWTSSIYCPARNSNMLQGSASESGIKMQPGKELSQVQQDYLVDVIMTWIQKRNREGGT